MSGIELDRLLENARWVRALGVELVGGGEADDLAQDAWVVALEQRGEVRNPAAWLAGVVRRLASRARRGNERRARREEAAAGPEAGPAADELVAEAELSRTLIRAVTELDEPFRSTVLLRFYRGWTPDEIARSHGVPSATVRTRLHRALARLRERLDREHGGREAWALAFASPGTLATGTIGGGALMGTKLTLGAAAVLAVAVGTTLWWGRDDSKASSAREEPRIAVDGEAPAARQTPPESTAREVPRALSSSVAARDSGVRIDEILLYGSATDPEGRPIELEWLGLQNELGVTRSLSKPGAGSYSLAGLAPGRYDLEARAEGFVSRREPLVVRADAEHQRHDLVLTSALAIPLRIVDENGALWKEESNVWRGTLDVVVTSREPDAGLSGFRRSPGDLYRAGEFLRKSDDEVDVPRDCSGIVRARVAPPFFVSLILRDATLATQRVDGPLDEPLFTARHDELAALRGGVHVRFVDATTGVVVRGGSANLDPPSASSGGPGSGTKTEDDGSATLEPFPPGLHRLRFFHPSYADTGRVVRVPSGRIEELGDVLVWPKATIRGSVLDVNGRPVSASVQVIPLAELHGPAELAIGDGHTAWVAGARFEFENVARGLLRVSVTIPEHARLVRTIDASSGLVEGLVFQVEEGVRVVLRTPEEWIGRQVTIADEAGAPLETWTVSGTSIPTRLARGRYELWLGRAERVDSRQELVVGDAPLVVDLARGGG
jgi:RNA polymerase sigma factor (sigma-70 family)